MFTSQLLYRWEVAGASKKKWGLKSDESMDLRDTEMYVRASD